MSEDKPTIEEFLSTKVQTLSSVPMQELLDSGIIPQKFADVLVYNNALNTCCRQVENITGRLFKSDPRLPHPDIFVATCKCKRNHIRVRADPVRYNISESEKDKIENATSILHQPHNSGVRFDG